MSECPHCPDGHRRPESRPWSAYVASERDGDGQPTHLRVEPSAGAHVAETDAEWLRQLLTAPLRIVQRGIMRGCAFVAGTCPSCGLNTLALGVGGYITCATPSCPEPSAASKALGA